MFNAFVAQSNQCCFHVYLRVVLFFLAIRYCTIWFFFYLLLKHISLHINNKTTILYIKHASIDQNYKRFPTSKYNLLS